MLVVITLSRKRILKNLSKSAVLLIVAGLFSSTIASCKSAKPRVITTKKQASRQSKNNDRVYTGTVSKRATETTENDKSTRADKKSVEVTLIDATIENALDFKGTRYKYGGNTRSGIDCSGLIHQSYKKAGKSVPRTSASLLDASHDVAFNAVKKGDLLFFATGRNKRKVNHVGMVVRVTPAEVQFIHSTSSRGVIVSDMNEPYWLNAYISAGRLD